MQDQAQQLMQQTLLAQLKDVHMPSAVSWWPPAIGWWILLFLAIALAVICIRALLKKRRANAYRREALSDLETYYRQWQTDGRSANYLQNANAILKRCLLSMEGQHNDMASQSGSKWRSVLQNLSGKPLSEQTLIAISELCYQPNPEVDIAQIHQELTSWIRHHRLPKANSKKPTNQAKANYA